MSATFRDTLRALVVITIAVGPASADDPPKPPLPKELTQIINLALLREDEPLKIIKLIEQQNHLRIEFDQPAIEKACNRRLAEMRLAVPSVSLPLGASVELIANQMNSTLKEIGGHWRIVPGRSNLTRFFSPATPAMQRRIKKLAEIEKEIAGAPADDIVEFFSEKYDVPILVAAGAPGSSVANPIGKKMCKMPVGKKPLVEFLKDIAAQINGQVTVYEELILIVPPDRGES